MTQATAELVAPLSEAEESAVRKLYQAFTDKNPDLLYEALAPDWMDIPLAPGQGTGPDSLKPIVQMFVAAMPDIQITVHEIIGTAGRAGARCEITGTHLGEIQGIPPSGKRVSILLHEFHHLTDGKITQTYHLEDWFGMMNQVGAWPCSGSPQGADAK